MFGLGFKFPQLGAGGLSLEAQIRKLFANGEEGALYYFTENFAGLYQDADGTMPVTAAGQPVGLMLDRRFGLARGEEIENIPANDRWEARADGWWEKITTGSSQLRATRVGNSPGTTYEAEVVIEEGHEGVMVLYRETETGTNLAIVNNLTAENTPYKVIFSSLSAGSRVAFIDSSAFVGRVRLTVRELPGNHASQSTTTARPTLQRDENGKLHLEFDGVDDQLVGMIPMALKPGMLLAAAQNRYDRNANTRTIGVVADSNINDYVAWLVTNAQREHFYVRGLSQGLDQVSTLTGSGASPLNTPSVGDVVVTAAPDPLRAYTNGIAHATSPPSNWPSGTALGSVATLTFPISPTVKLGVYGVVVSEGPVSVESQAVARKFLSRSIGASA